MLRVKIGSRWENIDEGELWEGKNGLKLLLGDPHLPPVPIYEKDIWTPQRRSGGSPAWNLIPVVQSVTW